MAHIRIYTSLSGLKPKTQTLNPEIQCFRSVILVFVIAEPRSSVAGEHVACNCRSWNVFLVPCAAG